MSAGAVHSATSRSTRPSAQSVLIRSLAQQGLAIGMANTVLQGNQWILEFGAPQSSGQRIDHCYDLSQEGGGNLGDEVLAHDEKSSTKATLTNRLYYDTGCSKPYITQRVTVTSSQTSSSDTYRVSGTWTMQSLKGAELGTFSEKAAAIDTDSDISVQGLGTFRPAGSQPAVSLGLTCVTPQSNGDENTVTEHCVGGVAQRLADLKRNLASLTPLSLTVDVSSGTFGKVTFAGAKATRLSSTGALTVGLTESGTLTIKGSSTRLGSDATNGQAAKFAMFTPTPTGWVIAAPKQHTSFGVAVKGSALTLSGSVKNTKTHKTLATLSLDRSGTGTIHYRGHKKPVKVLSWCVTG